MLVTARTRSAAKGTTPEHCAGNNPAARTSAGKSRAPRSMVEPTRPVPALRPMWMRKRLATVQRSMYALKTRRGPAGALIGGAAGLVRPSAPLQRGEQLEQERRFRETVQPSPVTVPKELASKRHRLTAFVCTHDSTRRTLHSREPRRVRPSHSTLTYLVARAPVCKASRQLLRGGLARRLGRTTTRRPRSRHKGLWLARRAWCVLRGAQRCSRDHARLR